MRCSLALPKKIYNYITTSVTPLDLIISKIRSENIKKTKVGWCSIFPPTPNGAAAANYFFLNELMKREEIELYAIPLGGRIDKKLFPGIRFAQIGSSYLDVVVFFGLGNHLKHIMNKARARTIVWQTLHEPLSTGGIYKDNIKLKDIELKILMESKKADLLIGLSKWAVQEYKLYGAKNVAYIPHAVDTDIFKRSKKPHAKFTVLFVSRVNYHKGIISFLDAIPLILKKHPNIMFKMHGSIDTHPFHSAHTEEIKSTLDRIKGRYPYNFLTETKWVDYSRLNEMYDGVDVLLFPSCSEGFGIPLIEAMSNGIPCIVADKPPMNEIVRNNKTGFCIRYRKGIEKKYHGFKFPHPEDIAEKIVYLIENKEVFDSMRNNCRKHVKDNYEIQQCADAFIASIKKVVNKKTGSKT